MYPKNFEDACALVGENAMDEKFASGTADEIGYKKLKVTIAAINKVDNDGKDWEPDFDDGDVEKWYPWWDIEKDKNNPSGFRVHGAGCDGTGTGAPARLCFKTEDGLRHSVDAFLLDWRAYISMRK